MEMAFSIYRVLVFIWYLVAVYMIYYIYNTCIKQYKVKSVTKKYEKKPAKIKIGELSYLCYKKIQPEVLTAVILDLIENKYLIVEEENGEYFISEKPGMDITKLTDSNKFVISMLNRIIDGKKRISVEKIYHYCDTNRNAVDFLINYEIFIKMLRNESENFPYYEPKLNYSKVNIFTTIGNLLFIVAIFFAFYKYYSYSGYLVIVVSYLIYEMFNNSYRRNKKANELYHEYLAYKRYLENIDNLGYDDKKIPEYIKTGLILKVENLNLKLNQNNFSVELNKSITRCVTKSLRKK